jgi:hypothetical protein
MKYDSRREDHKSVSDADISSLYSSLHKVKPKAVLVTGFPTSKSTNTSCPKNVLASDRLYHYIGMCYVCFSLMINHNVILNFQFRSSSSFFVSTRKWTRFYIFF